MINSGAIMSAALLLYMVKPELTQSEKFEYVYEFITRMAGGLNVGFQNSCTRETQRIGIMHWLTS